MKTGTRIRSVVALAAALMMVFAGVAVADDIINDIDSSESSMSLTVGGPNGSTILSVVPRNEDGKNGCNLTGGTIFQASVASSAPGVATVSPSSVSFGSCGATQVLTVTPVSEGSTVISLTETRNTTEGSFDVAPATFTVNVAPAPVTNRAPEIATAAADANGDEGSELSTSGAFSDPDGDALTISKGGSGAGTVIDNGDGSWSWSYTPDDNSSGTVVVEASDGDLTVQDSFRWTAVNVAPTATLTRVGPANVFTGTAVTYNASATDPSPADTLAGFEWAFNGGPFGTSSTLQQTYETCGAKTESVVAKDKDGGESVPATASVMVFDGGWHGAIKPAMRNQVQAGRVVPVQIRVACGEAPETGLRPGIQLIKGDQDPDTEPTSETTLATTSASSADTTGVMRPSDGGFIYNLQIPSNAKANELFTIRVRPWGSDGPALQALLQIRK